MKNKRKRTEKIALMGLTASLALLLSYVEFLLPPLFIAVPGIKVGLPNVVILFSLYVLGIKYAVLISITRVIISSMWFGSPLTLAYSLAGAVLSLLLMSILYKIDKLSAVGVSVAGGVTHNLGQVFVAMILLDTPQIAYYMIVLAVTGTVSGIFIGLCGAILIKRIPKNKIFKY